MQQDALGPQSGMSVLETSRYAIRGVLIGLD